MIALSGVAAEDKAAALNLAHGRIVGACLDGALECTREHAQVQAASQAITSKRDAAGRSSTGRKTAGPAVITRDDCTIATFEGLDIGQVADPVTAPLGVMIDNGDADGAKAAFGSNANGDSSASNLAIRGWPSPDTGLWPRKPSVEIKFTGRTCQKLSVGYLQLSFTEGLTFEYLDSNGVVVATSVGTQDSDNILIAIPPAQFAYNGWFKDTYEGPAPVVGVRVSIVSNSTALDVASSYFVDDVTCCSAPNTCDCFTASGACPSVTAASDKVHGSISIVPAAECSQAPLSLELCLS